MERACAVCLAVWLWARLPRAPRTEARGRGRAAPGVGRGPPRRAAARARGRAGSLALAARWGHVAGALFSTMARLNIYTCGVS